MTDDVYFWRGPATICFRAEEVFRPLYERVVGPIELPFRILGVDCDEGDAKIIYQNPPTGPRSESDPVRTIGYAVDRAVVTEAIARLVRVYSRRIGEKTAVVRPPSEDWVADLRHDFPRRFECPMKCDVGWSDMVRAMIEWLEEIGLPNRWHFIEIKERLGTLRAYSSGVGLFSDEVHRIRDVIAAFESVSLFVCERCGEPG